jgi:hypothetical protein
MYNTNLNAKLRMIKINRIQYNESNLLDFTYEHAHIC